MIEISEADWNCPFLLTIYVIFILVFFDLTFYTFDGMIERRLNLKKDLGDYSIKKCILEKVGKTNFGIWGLLVEKVLNSSAQNFFKLVQLLNLLCSELKYELLN